MKTLTQTFNNVTLTGLMVGAGIAAAALLMPGMPVATMFAEGIGGLTQQQTWLGIGAASAVSAAFLSSSRGDKDSDSSSWLKWGVRFLVMGVGLGLGTEIISEFIVGGAMHGTSDLAKEFFQVGIDFSEPFWDWLGGLLPGETAEEKVSGFRGFMKGIHESFGIEDSFPEPVLESASELLSTDKSVTTGDDSGAAYEGFGSLFGP